jgi:hypothetical protein
MSLNSLSYVPMSISLFFPRGKNSSFLFKCQVITKEILSLSHCKKPHLSKKYITKYGIILTNSLHLHHK